MHENLLVLGQDVHFLIEQELGDIVLEIKHPDLLGKLPLEILVPIATYLMLKVLTWQVLPARISVWLLLCCFGALVSFFLIFFIF